MSTEVADVTAVEVPVVADVPAQGKKKRNKSERKKSDRPRGRPAIYRGNVQSHLLALVRKHGLTGAINAVVDENMSRSEEDKWPVPAMPTLQKMAKKANIEVVRGRPKKAA